MIEPKILFEDSDILVIDKPCGMVVNTADSAKGEITVQAWVEERVGIRKLDDRNLKIEKEDRSSKVDSLTSHIQLQFPTSKIQHLSSNAGQYDIVSEFYSRGGIVHRLDKETSGVLVIAKNPESFSALKNQFMERSTQKTYRALAHGKIIPQEGIVNAPTGRLPFNRMHFGVIAGGREAVTEYKVIQHLMLKSPQHAHSVLHRQNDDSAKKFRNDKSEILSLVELHPLTGRTHQIRVHLKHLSHPIFSDELYAGRKTARDDRQILARLFLHAQSLRFAHPRTGEDMTITAPLPEELETFLESLEKL